MHSKRNKRLYTRYSNADLIFSEYLFHFFISSVSNKRTDQYEESFENRTRLIREVVELTRQVISKNMFLFLRISATDWLKDEKNLNN